MMAVARAGRNDYEDAGDQWLFWFRMRQDADLAEGPQAQGIEVKVPAYYGSNH